PDHRRSGSRQDDRLPRYPRGARLVVSDGAPLESGADGNSASTRNPGRARCQAEEARPRRISGSPEPVASGSRLEGGRRRALLGRGAELERGPPRTDPSALEPGDRSAQAPADRSPRTAGADGEARAQGAPPVAPANSGPVPPLLPFSRRNRAVHRSPPT